MRILIVWQSGSYSIRQTIIDHVFSFDKYDKENHYFYFDIRTKVKKKDYEWIQQEMFDAVIFHYTMLGMRCLEKHWKALTDIMSNLWKDCSCIKVLLPQDDYTCTEAIWNFANAIQANIIYTVIRECDYPILYPEDRIPNILVKTVLTGYVEEQSYSDFQLLSHEKRKYDCVYRARKLPYVFGKHGQLKYEIAALFNERLAGDRLVTDIKNTKGRESEKKDTVILGRKWIDFLASSRCTIGCLGGSSIVDFKGELSAKEKSFFKQNPMASYDECKKQCFQGVEENLTGMVSPRIFEAALTKTTQILVGADYQGILIPDVDYIMLKEDYSNLAEVIDRMKDIHYCEAMAEKCYEHVIASGKYTYNVFVEQIMKDIITLRTVNYPDDKHLEEKISAICKKKNKIARAEAYYHYFKSKVRHMIYLPLNNILVKE